MKITVLPKLDSKAQTPTIGSRIRQARIDCGLSQLELGQQLGYGSATALSFIETEQRGIDAYMLAQISHITGKEITYFYDNKPQKPTRYTTNPKAPHNEIGA